MDFQKRIGAAITKAANSETEARNDFQRWGTPGSDAAKRYWTTQKWTLIDMRTNPALVLAPDAEPALRIAFGDYVRDVRIEAQQALDDGARRLEIDLAGCDVCGPDPICDRPCVKCGR